MFQFPTFAPVNPRVTGSLRPGCPIRTSAGRSVFATRRGFSQLVTSFFASESLGIPHAPFFVPLISLSELKFDIEALSFKAQAFAFWFARVKLCLCFYSFVLADQALIIVACIALT